ncbi:hypothetical protein D3C85_1377370 [compost metagenome]
MDVLAGQDQGRAGRVPVDAGKVQQAAAVLLITFDFLRGKSLHLPQKRLAERRRDAGLLQAQGVDQSGQGALREALGLAFGQQVEAFFQHAPGTGAAESRDAGQQQPGATPRVAHGEQCRQGRAVGQPDGHQRR